MLRIVRQLLVPKDESVECVNMCKPSIGTITKQPCLFTWCLSVERQTAV